MVWWHTYGMVWYGGTPMVWTGRVLVWTFLPAKTAWHRILNSHSRTGKLALICSKTLFHGEVLGGGCLLHYSISGKCIDELKSRNFPIYEYFSREQYGTEDALLHLRFALCLKDFLVFF